MIKRSLRAFWLYVTLACVALSFMIAGIVLRSIENTEIRDYQAYLSTNCSLVGYRVNGSQNAWYVLCQFDLQPEGECCIRSYYITPPTGSSIYMTEESALADAPNLCPANTRYLCWYDSRNTDNEILLSPPSINNYDDATIICFAFMAAMVVIGTIVRLGCCVECPCLPCLDGKKLGNVPKSDGKSNYSDEKPKIFKLKKFKKEKRPNSTQIPKSDTAEVISDQSTVPNPDEVVLEVDEVGDNGILDPVQKLEVIDGNGNPVEDAQTQTMDEIPLNDEQQTTTGVDLNESDDSDESDDSESL